MNQTAQVQGSVPCPILIMKVEVNRMRAEIQAGFSFSDVDLSPAEQAEVFDKILATNKGIDLILLPDHINNLKKSLIVHGECKLQHQINERRFDEYMRKHKK